MSAVNTKFITDIASKQIKFEGVNQIDKFARFFADLYRIDLFKPGLDLILTKLQEKDLSFEIKLIKGWDTYMGCYLTEQSRVFNKIMRTFSTNISKKIIIKSFLHNVMAHEMAHALEFESGISLENSGFRKAVGFDMKGRSPELLTLKSQTKRLMIDALKQYPSHQFLSELFARYFELLSVSRDVVGSGDFETSDVADFFINTTSYIRNIFNPSLQGKINTKIASKTTEIVAQVRILNPQIKFQDKVNSFHKKRDGNNKSWSSNVKSNSQYQVGWKKFQEIEEDKK